MIIDEFCIPTIISAIWLVRLQAQLVATSGLTLNIPDLRVFGGSERSIVLTNCTILYTFHNNWAMSLWQSDHS